MSGFALDWLDLREPADRAARDPGLLEAAGALLDAAGDPAAMDLGCGSGATVRALAPVLTRQAAWRLVDDDTVLLEEALRRAGPGERLQPVRADIAAIERLDFGGAALVTASALLDLVSRAWVEALAVALAGRGAGFYAALTYDGAMGWSRAHPLDGAVTAAFNVHQRSDKGFGPALGSEATDVAADYFRAHGFVVRTAASPWRLGPDQAALERALVSGVANAVLETGAIDPADLDDWKRARAAWAGSAGCAIGHLDLLASPPP